MSVCNSNVRVWPHWISRLKTSKIFKDFHLYFSRFKETFENILKPENCRHLKIFGKSQIQGKSQCKECRVTLISNDLPLKEDSTCIWSKMWRYLAWKVSNFLYCFWSRNPQFKKNVLQKSSDASHIIIFCM